MLAQGEKNGISILITSYKQNGLYFQNFIFYQNFQMGPVS